MNTNVRAILKVAGGTAVGTAVGPAILSLLNTDWNVGAQLVVGVLGAVSAVVGWVKGVTNEAKHARGR